MKAHVHKTADGDKLALHLSHQEATELRDTLTNTIASLPEDQGLTVTMDMSSDVHDETAGASE